MTQIPCNQHITYQLQFRKCGKASCSTCRNTQGHGPYWYAYWREGSRLKSGYVGKREPEEEGNNIKKRLKAMKAAKVAVAAISS